MSAEAAPTSFVRIDRRQWPLAHVTLYRKPDTDAHIGRFEAAFERMYAIKERFRLVVDLTQMEGTVPLRFIMRFSRFMRKMEPQSTLYLESVTVRVQSKVIAALVKVFKKLRTPVVPLHVEWVEHDASELDAVSTSELSLETREAIEKFAADEDGAS